MMKKILCLAALSLLLVPRLGATDNKLEKQLEKTLSRMTLDQKIGQIIQLEINQITYYHPEYELTTLVGYGADKLGALIEKAGLGSRYHAEEMVRNLNPDDFATVYPFYLLSVDLAATEDFIPDEKKMETVFGQYHVGGGEGGDGDVDFAVGLDHGAGFGVLLYDDAALFFGIVDGVDDHIGEVEGVVVFELGEGCAAIVGQFVFFALPRDGFDEHEGQHDDNYRNHQHVEQVFDERVLFEEVLVHNCLY